MEYSKKEPAYQNVALADDKEDPRSSTEVDESVLGDDEKPWRTREGRHGGRRETTTQRYLAKFRRYRWIIDTLLLLVNISLSLLLVRNVWGDTAVARFQVGGDVNGLGPECKCHVACRQGKLGISDEVLNMFRFAVSTKIVKFNADRAFVPLNASEFLTEGIVKQWNTIMPGVYYLAHLHALTKNWKLMPTQRAPDGAKSQTQPSSQPQ